MNMGCICILKRIGTSKRKLELTLKYELVGPSCLCNHKSCPGWRAEAEISVGLCTLVWCLIRVAFCFPGTLKTAAPTLRLSTQEDQVIGVTVSS